MTAEPGEPFVPLAGLAQVRAAFIPRLAGVDTATDRATALERLREPHEQRLRALGFDPARLATAEQVHGDGVAFAACPGRHAGADALVTSDPGVVLGIYVADCAAVYLADQRGRAIGLVHSGRAGTAKNIVGAAIHELRDRFGVGADDLTVQLSPCIRPPLYEADFAAAIVAQAAAEGARDIRDPGICTGARVGEYYSYRVERGLTGRMLAVLALSSC
jgi:copper oxidase (laccase) domain-containing protein